MPDPSRLPTPLRGLPPLPRDADLELDFEMRQQAGVSIVARGTDDVDLLFIKRAKNPRDPWSGHMALPGGRREAADADLLGTAVRETAEETGIHLDPTALVGRMPKVAPRGPRLPTIVVVPFLFSVEDAVAPSTDPREVERAVWIPLDELRDPANLADYRVRLPAGERVFPSYRVGGEVVWGMTYRIVEDLLLLLSGERPHGLGDRS